jgi:hypothetical protein
MAQLEETLSWRRSIAVVRCDRLGEFFPPATLRARRYSAEPDRFLTLTSAKCDWNERSHFALDIKFFSPTRS